MSKPSLAYEKGVMKEIVDLPAKHYKQVVTKMLTLLHTPFPQDSKKVKGYDNIFRVDSGEYRIVYSVSEDYITIEIIGKRNDDEVYRLLARKF